MRKRSLLNVAAVVGAPLALVLMAAAVPSALAKPKPKEADPPECGQIASDIQKGRDAIDAAVGAAGKTRSDVDDMLSDLTVTEKKLTKTCAQAAAHNQIQQEQWKKQLKERRSLADDCANIPSETAAAKLDEFGLSKATDVSVEALRGLVPYGASLNPSLAACVATARGFLAKHAAPTAECSTALAGMSSKLQALEAFVKGSKSLELLDGWKAEDEKYRRAFKEVTACKPANTVELHARKDYLFDHVRAIDAHAKAKTALDKARDNANVWPAAISAANTCIMTVYQVHESSSERDGWLKDCAQYRDEAEKAPK